MTLPYNTYFEQPYKLKFEAKNSGVENHAAVGVLLGFFGDGFGLLPQAGPQFPQLQGAQKSDQTRRGEDPQWQQPGEQLRQRQAYRHRHQMDQHHCDRLPQVGKGQKECILQGGFYPVLKLGLQGKGVAGEHEPNGCRHHKYDPQKLAQGFVYHIGKQIIIAQQRCGDAEDQRQNHALFQIVPEAVKKAAENFGIFSCHQLLRHIVKGGGGRADGKNRDAADQPGAAEQNDVGDIGQASHDGVVWIK